MSDEAYDTIIEYHQRTKHSLEKYAAGPEALDWDAQPDPFRRFEGTQRISLPLTANSLQYAYADLLTEINSNPQTLSRASLGSFFQLSLGLTAWKQYGTDRWSLRCNPSSGNLHPTETYVILPALNNDITAGVYHYNSYDHSLEQRCLAPEVSTVLNENTFLLAFSSIHWREAWKYGERAYRYCQLDVGHALAAIRLAAAIHGWQVEFVTSCSDTQLESLIGLDRKADFDNVEKEKPDLLVMIRPTSNDNSELSFNSLIELLQSDAASWKGKANLLDPNPMYQWPIIDDVSKACRKTESRPQPEQIVVTRKILPGIPSENSIPLILQRRSAQAFDPKHKIPLGTLLHILETTLTQTSPHLFEGITTNIQLLIFVHRVEGLSPGLYMLTRDSASQEHLQQLCRKEFDWQKPDAIPEDLPLYHLVSANGQKVARSLACHQAIASEGMFSIAMLARFEDNLKDATWQYRRLHWEAGMVGQMIYLAAEAHGLRGTGMGCFFDDAVHNLLGMDTLQYQCLYQFTVGMPVIDARIANLPPYAHLAAE